MYESIECIDVSPQHKLIAPETRTHSMTNAKAVPAEAPAAVAGAASSARLSLKRARVLFDGAAAATGPAAAAGGARRALVPPVDRVAPTPPPHKFVQILVPLLEVVCCASRAQRGR